MNFGKRDRLKKGVDDTLNLPTPGRLCALWTIRTEGAEKAQKEIVLGKDGSNAGANKAWPE